MMGVSITIVVNYRKSAEVNVLQCTLPSQFCNHVTFFYLSSTDLPLDLCEVDPDSGNASRDVNVDVNSLSAEQRDVYNAIIEAIESDDDRESRLFFLSAPAGCGKTFVINCLINELLGRGLKYRASAFTAFAAALIRDSDTCHTTFGIPVRSRLSGTERSYLEGSTPEANSLLEASLIFIDEASMLSKVHMDIIDHLLRVGADTFKHNR
jgi:sigma54-dependent transcription regulator